MAGKSIRLKVDLEAGDIRILKSIQDLLRGQGAGAGSAGAMAAGMGGGPTKIAGANFMNQAFGMGGKLGGVAGFGVDVASQALSGAAKAYENPYATDRSMVVGAGRGVASAISSIPILGPLAAAPLNMVLNQSDQVAGSTEEQFGSYLADIGRAGVDASRPELREGLERIARQMRDMNARSFSNRRMVNQFSHVFGYGFDFQGIWNGG